MLQSFAGLAAGLVVLGIVASLFGDSLVPLAVIVLVIFACGSFGSGINGGKGRR